MASRWLRWATGPAGSALVLMALIGAPVQCAAHREPRRVRVTPPGEAVYDAAVHLREGGHERAYEATLRYIIETYPGSRAASRARDDLDRGGAGSDPAE